MYHQVHFLLGQEFRMTFIQTLRLPLPVSAQGLPVVWPQRVVMPGTGVAPQCGRTYIDSLQLPSVTLAKFKSLHFAYEIPIIIHSYESLSI